MEESTSTFTITNKAMWENNRVNGRPLTHIQVQLATSHEPTITLPGPLLSDLAAKKPPAAVKILAIIESEERAYQLRLSESYEAMRDQTFKNLRRALPLTRQKLDWDKVRTNYIYPTIAGPYIYIR